MIFSDKIIAFINASLKASSLNKQVLQPAKYHGLSTVIVRPMQVKKEPEYLPAIVAADGNAQLITPDSKTALQLYHKQLTNVYAAERKSYGSEYDIKSTTELSMVVITNSKLNKMLKEAIEPLIIFGMPQRLDTALMAELNINKCLITAQASNMDQIAVFRQEFTKSDYFLNEMISMFLIRYKVEMTFSQACIEKCLC